MAWLRPASGNWAQRRTYSAALTVFGSATLTRSPPIRVPAGAASFPVIRTVPDWVRLTFLMKLNCSSSSPQLSLGESVSGPVVTSQGRGSDRSARGRARQRGRDDDRNDAGRMPEVAHDAGQPVQEQDHEDECQGRE